MTRLISLIIIICSSVCTVTAQTISEPAPFHRSDSQEAIKISSDVFVVALPAVAIGAAIIQQDWVGLKQAAFTGVAAVGSSLILKMAIHKKRPDGSNFHSFPSGHTAISFASAAFIQRRYGWLYGAPAYAIATYVGWARIYAKKHDVWDVLAGAAIGAGSAYIFTRPFAKKHDLKIAPVTDGKSFIVTSSFTF